MIRQRTKLTKARYIFSVSATRMNESGCPKGIPGAVIPRRMEVTQTSTKCCFGKSDPLTEKNSKFRYEPIHTDTDLRMSVKFRGNPYRA